MDKKARAFRFIAWFFTLYIVWQFFDSTVLPNLDIHFIVHSSTAFEHPTTALRDYFLAQRIISTAGGLAFDVILAVFAWMLRSEYIQRPVAKAGVVAAHEQA